MKKNMGASDRLIRILLAASFILFALKAATGVWEWVLLIIGGVLLLTGLVSFCPLYTLFGIRTCKFDKHMHITK